MESFIKNFNEDGNIGYFPEAAVEIYKQLHQLLNDLPFLPERMNIEKLEKPCVKLVW